MLLSQIFFKTIIFVKLRNSFAFICLKLNKLKFVLRNMILKINSSIMINCYSCSLSATDNFMIHVFQILLIILFNFNKRYIKKSVFDRLFIVFTCYASSSFKINIKFIKEEREKFLRLLYVVLYLLRIRISIISIITLDLFA